MQTVTAPAYVEVLNVAEMQRLGESAATIARAQEINKAAQAEAIAHAQKLANAQNVVYIVVRMNVGYFFGSKSEVAPIYDVIRQSAADATATRQTIATITPETTPAPTAAEAYKTFTDAVNTFHHRHPAFKSEAEAAMDAATRAYNAAMDAELAQYTEAERAQLSEKIKSEADQHAATLATIAHNEAAQDGENPQAAYSETYSAAYNDYMQHDATIRDHDAARKYLAAPEPVEASDADRDQNEVPYLRAFYAPAAQVWRVTFGNVLTDICGVYGFQDRESLKTWCSTSGLKLLADNSIVSA